MPILYRVIGLLIMFSMLYISDDAISVSDGTFRWDEKTGATLQEYVRIIITLARRNNVCLS